MPSYGTNLVADRISGDDTTIRARAVVARLVQITDLEGDQKAQAHSGT